MRKESRHEGFTLVEILVVVVIIAVVSAVAITAYISTVTHAKDAIARNYVVQIAEIINEGIAQEGLFGTNATNSSPGVLVTVTDPLTGVPGAHLSTPPGSVVTYGTHPDGRLDGTFSICVRSDAPDHHTYTLTNFDREPQRSPMPNATC